MMSSCKIKKQTLSAAVFTTNSTSRKLLAAKTGRDGADEEVYVEVDHHQVCTDDSEVEIEPVTNWLQEKSTTYAGEDVCKGIFGK